MTTIWNEYAYKDLPGIKDVATDINALVLAVVVMSHLNVGLFTTNVYVLAT